METPLNISINFQIQDLPSCECGQKLLPVMDLAKEGSIPYLKGWMCLGCKQAYMFKSGAIYSTEIFAERNDR